MYHSQFNSGSSHYSNSSLPPPGWSGYSSGFQEGGRYSPEWNDGPRKNPMNSSSGGQNFPSHNGHGNYSQYNDSNSNQGNYGFSNQNYGNSNGGDSGVSSFYQDENFNTSNFMHPMHGNHNRPSHFHSQGQGAFNSRQNFSSMSDYMQQGPRDFRGNNNYSDDNFQGNSFGPGGSDQQRNMMMKGEPSFYPNRGGSRGPEPDFNRQGFPQKRFDSYDFGGPNGGSMNGPQNGPNRGSMNGPAQNGPNGGSMNGPQNGPNGGPMNGPPNGPNGGSMMNGPPNGPNGGSMMNGPQNGPNGRSMMNGHHDGPNHSNGFGNNDAYGPMRPMNGMNMNRRAQGPPGPRNQGFGLNDLPSHQGGSPPFGQRRSMGGPGLPIDSMNGPSLMESRREFLKRKSILP